ncbi:kinase-associated lipoprotein B [Bacillus fonticola]|uniref:kinase-associated lipoprotein B n=1 Tax=Bacillus fonticola TaxID=2728853 RepID=UPI0014751B6B|nr:kinase-associated lipoprotein B [Bacillus fonticola]
MQIGDLVTAPYKTGVYIGEVTQWSESRATVRVLAVKKHPKQGDLHNPNQTNVPFFHERKALSFREQTNVPPQQIKAYEGDVPDYYASLQHALDTYENKLRQTESPYARQALDCLLNLKKAYFRS